MFPITWGQNIFFFKKFQNFTLKFRGYSTAAGTGSPSTP